MSQTLLKAVSFRLFHRAAKYSKETSGCVEDGSGVGGVGSVLQSVQSP